MNRNQRRAKQRNRKGDDHNMVRKMAKARFASDTAHHIESDRRARRCYWLALIAINDAYGIGKVRVSKYIEALDAVANEYNKNVVGVDQEYADEKLRLAVERITGEPVETLYDDEWAKLTGKEKTHE